MSKYLSHRIIDINNEDDFMDWVRGAYNNNNSNNSAKNLIIVMNTVGGSISASDLVINILLKYPGQIDVYIPYYSFSAGTMVALTGDTINMSKFAQLGPTDPQLNFKDDYYSSKLFLDLYEEKTKEKIEDDTMIKSLESKVYHNDNLRNLERILDEKKIKNKDKLIELLGSGEYPHRKPLDAETLKGLGLPVNIGLDKKIDDLFQTYLSFKKEFKKLN